ncbi:peptide chain release factor N(5)-glutamine methyltransferase [Frankia sp. AgKG'84/4]|nr:peptide chain release factor N(5)-glutamine methyltransferase [Frankia sp. AgKG'84/4]MCL9793552.1 peptide chain release factor N(5)-glutamine methyltransferase [Frankia sp. AgKG'84/4]
MLADATERLRAAGVDSPRANAEQLAAFALDVPRSRLVLVTEVAGPAAERFAELVRRRADRVPLQHLTGVAGFRYLDLAVGPGVFVPRPETESVAGWAIDWLRGRAQDDGRGVAGDAGPVCVDLCAGSGAIALSLAGEVPGARVHAVEVDAAALVWLRRNVTASGRAVEVHEADVCTEPPASLTRLAGAVDLVVSNPPYLPDADRAAVQPEVGEYDPALALWGGPDGLDVVRAVVALAARLLRPGGRLVVEHADGHGAAAVALARADGRWRDIRDHPDLAGRDRFVTARRAVHGSTG